MNSVTHRKRLYDLLGGFLRRTATPDTLKAVRESYQAIIEDTEFMRVDEFDIENPKFEVRVLLSETLVLLIDCERSGSTPSDTKRVAEPGVRALLKILESDKDALTDFEKTTASEWEVQANRLLEEKWPTR